MGFGFDAQDVYVFLCDQNLEYVLFSDFLVNHCASRLDIGLDVLDFGGINLSEPLVFLLKADVVQKSLLLNS